MAQRHTLGGMVFLLPIIAVEEGGKGALFIKSLQLACSPIQVEVEVLSVVFNRVTEEDHMSLSQQGSRAEWTKLLSLVQNACKARIPVPKASIRETELCDSRKMWVLKCIGLATKFVKNANMRKIKMGDCRIHF